MLGRNACQNSIYPNEEKRKRKQKLDFRENQTENWIIIKQPGSRELKLERGTRKWIFESSRLRITRPQKEDNRY